ncbi:MAG: HD-GYP domain-containing protein [Dethiobacter sp.]|jgi:HD-GYP domain-containing protein (c-di-GMP phosphodiesterase class II)|nr:HD-GYP domain-containing protein [Dethiobacter sp.]
MRLIALWALRPGMVVARRVYDAHGYLLLNAGVVLEKEYIQGLKRIGLRSIYIDDPLIPDVVIEDVILEETRQKALKLVRDSLRVIKQARSRKIGSLLSMNKEFGAVLDDIVSQLLVNRNLTVNLTDIRSTDDYTFAHSVNVAVLSMIIAISMGKPRIDLINLGLGAFLHDIGKTLLPLHILNKPHCLCDSELEEIRKHPCNGCELVKKQLLINNTAMTVIEQHHERIDGAGYPYGLKDDDIAAFPRICSVADVYDALTSDRPYRPAHLPHQALEILDAESAGFDPDTLRHFYRHIAAYPVGTIVGLNNGSIGVVVHNATGYPASPKVRVMWAGQSCEPLEPYEVNLAEYPHLVVSRVYQDSDLPAAVLPNRK